ncbi:MAG: signal peptidase I [Planctomycetota bacterium]
MADPIGEARTAVEQSAAQARAAAERGKQKRQPTIGPVRHNLEAFGVAILGAVLLKWFCLEAFQIPTSSMQPTLMGSSEAGIYDRLLVDKLTPALREPQRWDVTVFGYPLQQNQNYVKRLVGLPGETLFIGGGNLYTVTEQGGQRSHQVLAKPDRIQEGLWKEVYPARLLLHEGQKPLGGMFFTTFASAWSAGDEPGSFTVQLEPVTGRTYKMAFRDDVDGGFVNRVWDGYPTNTAQAIRADNAGRTTDLEIVPDARIAAVITPEQRIDELVFEIEVQRPGQPTMGYSLRIAGGTGTLRARSGSDAPFESAGFVCELPAGVATEVAFAHLDDHLIAWRDGEEVLRLPIPDYAIRSGCELPTGADGVREGHSATPQILLKGQGKVSIDELRIWRDLHYTKSGFPHAQDLIRIPEGHYFMMGDNTLQSVDSRGWTAITLGALEDGTVVHPDTARATEGARLLRGNKRVIPGNKPPDRDETPVVIASRDKIAMLDELGEVHALDADARVEGNALFISPPTPAGAEGEWQPPEEWVPFVPREHIRGRALLIFWRWPFPQLTPIR